MFANNSSGMSRVLASSFESGDGGFLRRLRRGRGPEILEPRTPPELLARRERYLALTRAPRGNP